MSKGADQAGGFLAPLKPRFVCLSDHDKGDGTGDNGAKGGEGLATSARSGGGGDTGLGVDGRDKRRTTGRANGGPKVRLAAEDGRRRETGAVRGLVLPLDVRDEDLTGARSAEGGRGHRGLEEEEGEVGRLVGGGVGGDDRGEVGGGGTLKADTTLERGDVLREVAAGDRDGGGQVRGLGNEAGRVGNGLVRRRRRGGGVGGNLLDTVGAGTRVLGADGRLEGREDVKDVVELENLGVAGLQLGGARTPEVVEPSADSGVVTSRRRDTEGLEGSVDLGRGGSGARGGRERRGGSDQGVDARLESRVGVEGGQEGRAARRDARRDKRRGGLSNVSICAPSRHIVTHRGQEQESKQEQGGCSRDETR